MTPDVAIIGGGLAGIWTLRRLLAAGFNALLIEKTALGSGQTIASQGVVHGGLKYALNGLLNDASETIGRMPRIWDECLAGTGELDLSDVTVHSRHQYLFSASALTSKLTLFFAGKTLAGRSEAVREADLPSVFRTTGFRGSVYRLEERVLDVTSLLAELAGPVMDKIIHAPEISLEGSTPDSPEIRFSTQTNEWIVAPRLLILSAGAGNEALVDELGLAAHLPCQKRPLHQVMIDSPRLPDLWGVAIGTGTRPPFVVTTHTTAEGSSVWYLGGDLAETGVAREPKEQIEVARDLVLQYFPTLDLSDARWSTLRVDRAEGLTSDGSRPTGPTCRRVGNVVAVWPTKLVMAPLAAEMVLAEVGLPKSRSLEAFASFSPPPVAQPFWEGVPWV